LSDILTPLTFEEAIETTKIHSIAGLLQGGAGLHSQPFRAPHHTIRDAGLIGGGAGVPRSGEVSLAHNGVLFLDEFPEFPRNVLESLRRPLEALPFDVCARGCHESVRLRVLRRCDAALRR
jgi:magnesium chelatase family protein